MRWLKGLLGGRRAGAPSAGPDGGQRYVVVDCETTGLDTGADALISIGAVAVRDGRILACDSFERVLRPARTGGRDNILVHRIGEAAQRGGDEPREACAAFLDYVADAPLVAFHASFDRAYSGDRDRPVRDRDRQCALGWVARF